MKVFKNIQGSQEYVPHIEVNIDTVYVRSNIIKVDKEDFTGWKYDEVQYDKNEYIELLSSQQVQQDEFLIDNDFRLSLLEMGCNV